MKKTLFTILCLAFLLVCTMSVVGCGGSASQNLEMVLNKDMTFSVKSIGLCGDKNIVIPETYNGSTVVAIEDGAFAGYAIESVVIPKTVKYVGENAFLSCENLKKVEIKSDNLYVDYRAFAYCTALESVKIKKGTTYGVEVFMASGIKKVTFESGITRVDDYLFSGARNLEEVELSEEITEIGDGAFFNSGIEEIDLPDSITSIGASAFQESKLKGILIPSATVSLGNYVFADCAYLEYVSMEAGSIPSSWSGLWNCDFVGEKIDVELLYNGHVHDNEVLNKKDASCIANGYVNYKCKICNKENTVVLEKDKQSHVANEGDWRSDPDEHWKQCIYCTVRFAHGEHTYENGKCTVCGRT